jgi:uncharacterized protein HemY
MFWPGLDQVWHQGDLLGFSVVCLQTLLLNAALVSSLVWTSVVAPRVRLGLWCLCGSFWLIGLVHARWTATRRRVAAESDSQLDLFLAARGEYLRGEWSKAAELLQQLLRSHPRDVEARLMLATLLRHEGQVDEAREHLRKLQRLESAGRWNEEIQREWQQLTWQRVVQEALPAEGADVEATQDVRSQAA